VYLLDASEVVAGMGEDPGRRDAVRARLLEARPKGGYRVVPYSLSKQ
jgi:hypothetical protein